MRRLVGHRLRLEHLEDRFMPAAAAVETPATLYSLAAHGASADPSGTDTTDADSSEYTATPSNTAATAGTGGSVYAAPARSADTAVQSQPARQTYRDEYVQPAAPVRLAPPEPSSPAPTGTPVTPAPVAPPVAPATLGGAAPAGPAVAVPVGAPSAVGVLPGPTAATPAEDHSPTGPQEHGSPPEAVTGGLIPQADPIPVVQPSEPAPTFGLGLLDDLAGALSPAAWEDAADHLFAGLDALAVDPLDGESVWVRVGYWVVVASATLVAAEVVRQGFRRPRMADAVPVAPTPRDPEGR